jgi:hypothetical protein
MTMLLTLPEIEAAAPRCDFPPGPLLREPGELQSYGLRRETAVGLADARVFWADYDLLQHDFPELRRARLARLHPELDWLEGDSARSRHRDLIDAWLVENAAVISQCQAEQSEVNTPIRVTDREHAAHRPFKYGRALVVPVGENRPERDPLDSMMERGADLLDIKGTGCAPDAVPAFGTHRNGLLKLSDGFIELLNQRLLGRIFRHGGATFDTVPIYALIDPGFDIREVNGAGEWRDRAALLVRRAHAREERSGGLAPYGSARQIVQLETELFLRRYGISSCNPVTRISLWSEEGRLRIRYGRTMIDFCTPTQLDQLAHAACYRGGVAHYDGVNVQHVREVGVKPCRTQLVDFGTYRVYERFDNPVVSLVSDRLMRWGGTIRPGTPRFVQPDPSICVPFDLWGADGPTHGYPGTPGQTKQDTLCEGLANDYRDGVLDRDDIQAILDDFLDAATRKW